MRFTRTFFGLLLLCLISTNFIYGQKAKFPIRIKLTHDADFFIKGPMKTYFSSGELSMSGQFRTDTIGVSMDDLLVWQVRKKENGSWAPAVYVKAGFPVDTFTQWRNSGFKFRECVFKDGLKHIECITYKEGNVKSNLINYQQKQVPDVDLKEHTVSCKCELSLVPMDIHSNSQRNGKYVLWDENGGVMLEGNYMNGKVSGKWYRPNPNKYSWERLEITGDSVTEFRNGKRIGKGAMTHSPKSESIAKRGEWTYYDQFGNVQEVFNYDSIFRKDGVWRSYYKSGNLRRKFSEHGSGGSFPYSSFSLINKEIGYWDNGKSLKKWEGKLKGRQRIGIWTFFAPNGKSIVGKINYLKNSTPELTVDNFPNKNELEKEMNWTYGNAVLNSGYSFPDYSINRPSEFSKNLLFEFPFLVWQLESAFNVQMGKLRRGKQKKLRKIDRSLRFNLLVDKVRNIILKETSMKLSKKEKKAIENLINNNYKIESERDEIQLEILLEVIRL